MTIRFHSSVIVTDDVPALASFYRDVLQQEVVDDFGACVVFAGGLSVWHPREEHAVARHLNAQGAKDKGGPFELCFETEEFEDVVEALRARDVTFLHEVQTESWGQFTVRFFDPAQNLVEVGESIPCFVQRLFGEGNSLEEVAEHTGVPLDKVKQICEESSGV